LWLNTDAVTKWIQIAALIVGAYWAYTKFLTADKPGLEVRVEVSAVLKQEKPGPLPHTCYVYLNLSLKNAGTVSFDIKGAHVQAWRSDTPKILPVSPTYLDPFLFKRGTRIIDMENQNLLDMHFSPGESAGRTFTWIFPMQAAGLYLFTADFEAFNSGERKHISTSTWSQHTCTGK
jgi:hypothetical protein